MVKIKMYRKRRRSISSRRFIQKKIDRSIGSNEVLLREDIGISELDPNKKLLDPNLIGPAIFQCLIENDPEGVMEIIESHLRALNKSKFLKDAKVPRSTLYQLLKRKNPTIRTLAKIMYATHHSH